MTFKEYLISKGLTEEQATTIVEGMPESKFYLSSEEKADERYAKVKSQKEQLEEQLATNQSELNSLKEAAKGNEELTAKYNELQEKFDKSRADSKAKIADGKLQGFDEQLKGLQENKSFLFQQATEGTGTSPTITVGGNAKGGQNSAVGPQPEKLNEFRITR
jgi:chromosome segregation ATPase